jgi:acetyltransferase-like isoleucine patch superfamily enzyme
MSVKNARRLFLYLLPQYYRLKIALYRQIFGPEAPSFVLYNSLFPQMVLRVGGAKIGTGTRIYRWLTIHESNGTFENLVIGDNVHIGKHVLIDLAETVTIKDRVGVGMYSRIITHRNYGDSELAKTHPEVREPVVIGEDSVLCVNAILLVGTKLGRMCHVLPNSVVSGQFGDNVTLVGNPARATIRTEKRNGCAG